MNKKVQQWDPDPDNSGDNEPPDHDDYEADSNP